MLDKKIIEKSFTFYKKELYSMSNLYIDGH
jgi:hypothetical protein